MQPRNEFAVIVAGVVTANTFQLIDASGDIVAELGFGTTPAGQPLSRFLFRHLDAAMTDSYLYWTQDNGSGEEEVGLIGPYGLPDDANDRPALVLARRPDVVNGASATLRSGWFNGNPQAILQLVSDSGAGGYAQLDADDRVQINAAGDDVFNTDPFPTWVPVFISNGVQPNIGTTGFAVGTVQRCGRNIEGTFNIISGGAGITGGGGTIYAVLPNVAPRNPGGQTVPIGHGYIFYAPTSDMRTCNWMSNGELWFTGAGGAPPNWQFGPGRPWVLGANVYQINISYSYEAA